MKTLDRKDQAIQIRNRNKEIRKAKPTEIGSQYTWTRWSTPERKLKWRDICWQMKTHSIQFRRDLCMISYITNQPIYKKGLTENIDCNCNCELCGKSDTLARTLGGGGRGGCVKTTIAKLLIF